MTMLNEHLEHHVKQLLLKNEDLSSQRIRIAVENGTVTLNGDVQSFRRKLAAQKIVEADSNVDRVQNELVVQAMAADSDTTISANVNRAIDAAVGLAGESIRVDSKAGTVVLTGYVATELQRLHAVDVAASVNGVRVVNNLLLVNAGQVASNQKHAKRIARSIKGVIGMEDEQIRLSVVNETARLSGTVDALWKKEKAQDVAVLHSVLNVANEIVVNETR